MTAYALPADMLARYPLTELIQRTDPTASTPDALMLNHALGQAAGLIDRHLSPRYSLPLAVVPHALTDAACAIARWHLYDYEPPEMVQRLFDDAISWLRRLESGSTTLPLPAPRQARHIAMQSTPRKGWDA